MIKNVLICGGGIAGPALALELQRRGVTVTVVERAPALRTGGQTVDLRGAGRTVAARMGLLAAITEVAMDQRGIAWARADGSISARMPVDAFGGEGIVSEIEVLRGDLSQVLYAATLSTVDYIFDDTITALDQTGDGVDVHFRRSGSRRFDLVVGADGAHSTVRRLAVAPDADCTVPLGLYTSWFTAPAGIDLDGWYLMYNEPGGRVASVRPSRNPHEHKASLSFRSPRLPIDPTDVAAQKALIAERFAGAGWHVPALLDAVAGATDFAFEEVQQVRLNSWSRDRVVLLGDAAWCPTPLTGLGTSVALVGAHVLAGELTSHADHTTALQRYEQVLREYVTTAQALPPGGVGGFAPMRGYQIAARSMSMRLMTRWPLQALLAGQFSKAERIDLPEYPIRAAERLS